MQAHEDAVEFFRGKALAGGDARDVTHQIGELVVADANTEVLPGDFFNLVCFVEDDGAVFGNDARVLFVPHREIGEEEVMVDDDDVALMRLAMHLGDEATLELLALLAGAGLAAGVDFGPRRRAFGKRMDLGAVASYGILLPIGDDLEVVEFLESGEDGLFLRVVDFLAADVVAAALHVADLELLVFEVLLEERNVLEKELFLQVFGACGDDDAAFRKDRGNKVGERFSGASAGLDDEVAIL